MSTQAVTRRSSQHLEVPQWVDVLILAALTTVSILSLISMIQNGTFSALPAADTQLSWHIARASGLVSYVLLAASTIWGVFLTTRIIKEWTPGTVSLLLHASASWLAVVLLFVHVGILLFDKYYAYTLRDLLVPFTGPYRPLAVGLGTLAAWLIVAITISFSMRRLIGNRAWKLLHYTSYAAFALATLHSVTAGTDATKTGMSIVIGTFSVLVTALLIWRVSRVQEKKLHA